ncbi:MULTISPECIES: DoxX family protein [unclassified Luteimonas]|uniref:DoxX family protein n=1 Tax=unclassified Luteimonas TaxID=2629088 RepID=UPI0018F0824A|nr:MULTISPECIES: DoxX family protein [unclassified Luteimonas]MBJ6982482.1 DoxX family protein [Luteimonas sp. MC1572]MBJ7574940.1 DoxX family protein [Luteimonas sp. MC1828]QQO03740.1 DoxX family protein [Luteimonas sp. MC1572]
MNQAAMHDAARLLLRITLGVLVLLHGVAKLRGGMSGIERLVEANGLPGVLAYGVLVGEVLAPLMVLLGFHARLGAALVAINMLFAIVLAHMGQLGQLNGEGGWALELQGMFLATAVAIMLLGPGRYGINER